MASKISQLSDLLKGSFVMDENPLTSYFAAKACINANRKVGVERRFNTMRTATKNFRVMVSIVDNGYGIRDAIRIYRPDTKQEFIFHT